MTKSLDPADKKPGASNHQPPLIECGRDEMNLIDIPFTLAVRRTTDLKVMPDCLKSKNAVVKGSEGIPLAYAEDVYIGMMALSRAQEFQEKLVHFSQWGLLNLIGWRDNPESYKRLEKMGSLFDAALPSTFFLPASVGGPQTPAGGHLFARGDPCGGRAPESRGAILGSKRMRRDGVWNPWRVEPMPNP